MPPIFSCRHLLAGLALLEVILRELAFLVAYSYFNFSRFARGFQFVGGNLAGRILGGGVELARSRGGFYFGELFGALAGGNCGAVFALSAR